MLVEIKTDATLDASLRRLIDKVSDLTPVMANISEILFDQAMQNFAQEGRPGWTPLSEVTVALRGSAHPILQVSGELKAAVHPFHDAHTAGISVAKPYARIQQLGGKAGRGHKVTIPARPYLPVTADGKLQPEAETAIVGALNDYFATLA